MTYNFSSYPRMDPCISARTACITDPRYHHNFDPCYHNRFDPRHDGLDLNIQLPDFDLNIPPCPPCPSYPQPKPDTGLEPKTKEPEPFDILKLVISTLPGTDKIVNLKTNKETGLGSVKCGEIIKNAKNDLEIVNGKIVGKCYDSPECDKCVEALNSSIITVLATDKPFFPLTMDLNLRNQLTCQSLQ